MLINAYIARETEHAVALVLNTFNGRPLWVPRSKISRMVERDEVSVAFQLEGERIKRICIPVECEVEDNFMARVGV